MNKVKLPTLSFRLGLVGNRDLPDANTETIKQTVSILLNNLCQSVKALSEDQAKLGDNAIYANKPPQFYLINSLAEGADQLAAEEAHKLSTQLSVAFKLICPIPFSTEQYQNNLTNDNDRQQFNYFLDQAFDSTVIEMDFSNDSKAKKLGYRAAADRLLDYSDILIAIYDDDKDGGLGGTINTVNIALQQGLPVFHIHPKTPEKVRLYLNVNDLLLTDKPYSEQELVNSILLPFEDKADNKKNTSKISDKQPHSYQDVLNFYNEALLLKSGPRFYLSHFIYWFYAPIWKILFRCLKVFSSSKNKISFSAKGVKNKSILKDYTTEIIELQKPIKQQKEKLDVLAGFYMDLYRGSFILNFILGALAVLLAVMSYFGNAHLAWSVAELVCLLIILSSYALNRKCGWQKKAVDYRFMAEYFRHFEMLIPLGRNASILNTAAHHHTHNPGNTWMGWYLKAVSRSIEPFKAIGSKTKPSSLRTVVKLDNDYLYSVKNIIQKEWLLDQYNYHSFLHKRYSNWERISGTLMIGLFLGTITGVVMHMLHFNPFGHPESWHKDVVLALIVTVFPAFLAAIHGITVQGEVKRLAERSNDLAGFLITTIKQLNEEKSNEKKYYSEAEMMANLTLNAAQIMQEEVTDWQVLYRAHKVEVT